MLLGCQVSFEDRFQDQHRCHLHHSVADGSIPNGLCLPLALGIITRRTASGSYLFAFNSCPSCPSHCSTPSLSICSNSTPSTPLVPPLARLRRQASARTSAR